MKGKSDGRDLQIRRYVFLLLTEYTKPPSELKEKEDEAHTVCYALSYGQF